MKPDTTKWKKTLTEKEYTICFLKGTEAPFSGKYWNHHEPGTYHCVACGNPLFSWDSKFDSGTGWPSFSKVIKGGSVAEQADTSQGVDRTEVCCANCGAHLGHVFPDGPPPTGSHYCINSLALTFHPKT